MPRKRAERGSIARLDRNRYRIRYWGDKGDGKGYRRLSANFTGTLTEARRERDRLIAKYATTSTDNMTVEQAYERLYMPDCEKRGLSPTTLAMYRSTWNRHVRPEFGDRLLRDVKPLEIQHYVDGMTKNQALKTINQLSGIYKIAVRFEQVDRNPVVGGLTVPNEAKKMDAGVYKMEEMIRLADSMRGSHVEATYLLSAFGSCRVGEALAVKPTDIRLVETTAGLPCAAVSISKQAMRDGSVENRVKTVASDRWVIVPGPWGVRLAEIARRRDAEGHEWMYEGLKGNPVSLYKLGYTWREQCEIAGMEAHPFRNLRNSWRTSWQYEVGVAPDTLELLMGHKGETVSAEHYVRPDLMMLAQTVAAAFVKSGFVS